MDPLNYSRRFPKAPDHILKFALMNFKIWNLAHFHRLFCLSEIPIYLPLLMKIPFFFKTLSFVHISLTTSWARTTVDLKGTFLGGGLHKEKASRESPDRAQEVHMYIFLGSIMWKEKAQILKMISSKGIGMRLQSGDRAKGQGKMAEVSG